MKTRRESIQQLLGDNFNPTEVNASLWLDKYIEDATNDKDGGRMEFVNEVVRIKEPEIYKDYFQKVWKNNLEKCGAKQRKAKVKNRLAINLGSESVLETNISLHRIFGTPFIPGSSLKGMTAAFVRQYGDWKKDGDFYITVFGDGDNAGFISFYDALYIPKTGFNEKPLYADVMTTHHQDYYGGGNVPPADWDSPNPVPFISATGKYLIALSAPEGCEDWINLTFDILGFALSTEGIGAKTSSGYGRLKLQDENGEYSNQYENITSSENSSNSQNQEISESDRIASGLIVRINALRNNNVAGSIPEFAKKCLEIEDDSAKRQVARAIKQKVIDTKREKKSKGKDWYEKILPFTEDADWIVTPKS